MPYDPSWLWTSYHHAIANGTLADNLCNSSDIDSPDVQGVTPLHMACLVGRVEDVHMLLDKGADPNTSCIKFGSSPLITAVRHNYEDIVRLLLAHKARIDHVDVFGLTASGYATTRQMLFLLERR